MKIKKKKQKEIPSLKERLEDFLHSDSIPANTTKFLLVFLALGGVVGAAAILPGLLKALDSFGLRVEQTGYGKKQLRSALDSLRRQKLAQIIRDDEGMVSIELTNKGKRRVKKYSIDILRISKPAKWDGKWRVLMFDIPSYPKIYNLAREALRGKIKDLGFYQLQKSAWVYPYECEDELLFVAEAFQVQKHIQILTVERLLHEGILKRKFGLSQEIQI